VPRFVISIPSKRRGFDVVFKKKQKPHRRPAGVCAKAPARRKKCGAPYLRTHHRAAEVREPRFTLTLRGAIGDSERRNITLGGDESRPAIPTGTTADRAHLLNTHGSAKPEEEIAHGIKDFPETNTKSTVTLQQAHGTAIRNEHEQRPKRGTRWHPSTGPRGTRIMFLPTGCCFSPSRGHEQGLGDGIPKWFCFARGRANSSRSPPRWISFFSS